MKQSLSTPPADTEVLTYRTEIASVRRFVAAQAKRLACQAARSLTWSSPLANDNADLTDEGVGQTRPAPDQPGGGRGLWAVRQVCDRVEISTKASGLVIRVHMQRSFPGRQPAGAR